MPVHFIVMDLVDRFKPIPQGHQYALKVIDMLKDCTWYIQLLTKEVVDVMHTHIVNISSVLGGSCEILLDNETEFKNKLFAQVAFTLGMKQVFSSFYYP